MGADGDNARTPSTWAVIGSVLAAGFGVQSNKSRERDFSRGSLPRYVIAGLVGTVVFVIIMYGVVRLVLMLART